MSTTSRCPNTKTAGSPASTRTLSRMLTMRMGRNVEIWRDSKLSGSDSFADEIIQHFPKTALLSSW